MPLGLSSLRRRAFLLVVLPLLLVLGFPPAAGAQAPAPQITMIDLGTLGSDQSAATDINEQGQVVGTSSMAAGYEPSDRAVLWQVEVAPPTPQQLLATLSADV
jgi:probable HAF family extracellular repeat protein